MDEAGSREPFCRGEETMTKNGRHSSGRSLADVERMAPAAASTLIFAKQRKPSKSRTP